MAVRSYKVLSDELCDALVELFENDSEHHERVDNQSKPTFTQLNLNQHHAKIVPTLVDYALDTLEQYKNDVPSAQYLPAAKHFEEFRVKRYKLGGSERFDEHVDVASYDTAKRALAFLFYLNDNNGKTVFTRHGLNISPTCGRVIVFPPTWEYPHAGLAPSDNTKYIMSTYLHYG